MSFVVRRAQINARPDKIKEDEARKIIVQLRAQDPEISLQTAETVAHDALDFSKQARLRGSDSVLGVAFLIYAYGRDVFARDPKAQEIADPTRPEAERKTLIHAELIRLETDGR